MPPPLRDASKLGAVVNDTGQYRAEIFARGLGRLAHIRGPRRGSDKKRAFEDLLTIRDAATEESTRMGALLAMKRAADRLKEGNETAAEGGVDTANNEFRARVQYSENGDPHVIKGPRRSSECHARADLELIIAAAASVPGRAERFEAMSAEAHRLQERLEAEGETEVGGVVAAHNEFRARVQYSESGEPREIKGPRRSSEHRAQRDLEMINAAGCDVRGRAERIEAMDKEAHRLQASAGHETMIAMELGRRQFDRSHIQAGPDFHDDEEDYEASTDDDPLPYYDVSTREARESLVAASAPAKQPSSAAPPTNAVEATIQLATYHASPWGLARLRLLLDMRADPNIVIGDKGFSPLRTVIVFACVDHVEMRDVLLSYGARETKEDRESWQRRRLCREERGCMVAKQA